MEELSFVEAARIFHANAKEKSVPLPECHHDQVNCAVDHYHETLKSEAVRDQIVDNQIGPNERKALQFLNIFIAHPTLASPEEKTHLKHAQIAIRKAAFGKLQRDLVKLEKAQKKDKLKPAALLDRILEIISRYDFSSYDGESAEDLNAGLSAGDLEPVIILSESFSSPA